jgi:hypothetical protein
MADAITQDHSNIIEEESETEITGFKPVTMSMPRMNRSAALRQGLDWAAINSPKNQVKILNGNVPGYKREGLNIVSPFHHVIIISWTFC